MPSASGTKEGEAVPAFALLEDHLERAASHHDGVESAVESSKINARVPDDPVESALRVGDVTVKAHRDVIVQPPTAWLVLVHSISPVLR